MNICKTILNRAGRPLRAQDIQSLDLLPCAVQSMCSLSPGFAEHVRLVAAKAADGTAHSESAA